MSFDQSALAYIPETAELRRVFGRWPGEVGLALYLQPDGRCAAVPFLTDRRDGLVAALAQLFGPDPSGIGVFPPEPGQPEAALLWSDEQQLLHLLAGLDAETVLAPAHDMALNHLFACEEGIDLEASLAPFAIDLAPGRAAPEPSVDAPDAEVGEPVAARLGYDRAGGLVLRAEGAGGMPRALPPDALVRQGEVLRLEPGIDPAEALSVPWCLPIAELPAALVPVAGQPPRHVLLVRFGQCLFLRPDPEAPVTTPDLSAVWEDLVARVHDAPDVPEKPDAAPGEPAPLHKRRRSRPLVRRHRRSARRRISRLAAVLYGLYVTGLLVSGSVVFALS